MYIYSLIFDNQSRCMLNVFKNYFGGFSCKLAALKEDEQVTLELFIGFRICFEYFSFQDRPGGPPRGRDHEGGGGNFQAIVPQENENRRLFIKGISSLYILHNQSQSEAGRSQLPNDC